MTTIFNPQTPPLLTPLLTSSARAHALCMCAHGGHCLNCNGTDHGMKTRSEGLLNTSGILNPALGKLHDGGHACRRWQQRTLSYRHRGRYDRNPERSSNSYDDDNNNQPSRQPRQQQPHAAETATATAPTRTTPATITGGHR